MAHAPRLRGVLLDVDGTLLDSNEAHARAWVDALAEIGRREEVARLRRLIGMGADNLLPSLGIDPGSPEGKQASNRSGAIFLEQYLRDCRPFPGARDLVHRMREEGLECVVATSASKKELQHILRAARVDDLVDEATTASDAESSKPDPDIVQAAVRRAELPPRALVMLGDTPYDVRAARDAGVGIVALRCGGWSDRELDGALAVYDDPASLLAAWDDSPFGARAAG